VKREEEKEKEKENKEKRVLTLCSPRGNPTSYMIVS
jgi:hypothetical protein